MAEPNLKRSKMDDPSEKNNSGISHNNSLRDVLRGLMIVNPSTQSFKEIRRMDGFVDHTNFINNFLQEKEPKLAIFAPRRFGKSSQLDMVKMFLKIDVDKHTRKFSLNGLAETRKNYQLFNGTEIMKYKEIVEDHLGKHPVIHVDFKRASLESIEEAESFYRMVVHRAYCEHLYLRSSENLVPNDKEANATAQRICRKWCSHDRKEYMKQSLTGLENLTEYLYNHFDGAKVFILVDEFDAFNVSALIGVSTINTEDRLKTLQAICKILADTLAPVTKDGHAHVGGVLITGVSCMYGLGYSPLINSLTKIKFLEGPNIFPKDQNLSFYGATKKEIVSLIQRLIQNKLLVEFEGKKKFLNDTGELDADKIIVDVESHYNGYFDMNGEHIFCMWSVLQYLQAGYNKRNYWNETDCIPNLFKILECGNVAYEIMKLMRGDMIEFEPVDVFRLEDLVKFFDLIFNENAVKVDPTIVFNFLKEQGYLSYPEGGIQGQKFKLPNAEIRAALRHLMEKFCNVSTISCTSLIKNISFALMKNDEELQKTMLAIYRNLSQILKELERKDRALVNEAKMLCVMYKTLDDARSFELANESQIKDANGQFITSDRPDFLMLRRDDNKFSILWELKLKKDSVKDEYTTSLYALQEAMGKVPTKNGKTKENTELLKKLGREALIIGLSINSNFKVSLSYSSTMEEKIFSISEEEHELYPELYETYKPIMLSC